jgi:hypothetical protein
MSADTATLLRLPELKNRVLPDVLTFSGGVSEYIYGREPQAYGDLGPELAKAVLAKAQAWGAKIGQPDQGIRATVIGASQYTVQVSGSTIYVEPAGQLPLRNVPVIAPVLDLPRCWMLKPSPKPFETPCSEWTCTRASKRWACATAGKGPPLLRGWMRFAVQWAWA